MTWLSHRGTRRMLVASAAALCWASFLPLAWPQYRLALEKLGPLYRAVASTTFEERRLAAYGDCENLGYGYLTQVLRSYPDGGGMPDVRYSNNPPPLTLPALREHNEPRVRIGIGIPDGDFLEKPIASAARRALASRDEGSVSRWTFQTTWNYELLTALQFRFGSDPLPAQETLRVALVTSPTNAARLGEWVVEVPSGHRGPFTFALPAPLEQFSQGRGATDFILEVEQRDGAAPLSGITPIGAKLNGKGFAVVHRRGACFTAVREDLLAEIRRDPGSAWATFVERMRDDRLP